MHPTVARKRPKVAAPSSRSRRGTASAIGRQGGDAPPLPLSAEILSTVAAEIVAGKLPPGSKLEEEDLCHRFSASRTPVREALRQLAAQGLAEIRPRQGAFVVELGVEALAEMFECMGHLEASCAALAARRHSSEDRIALSESHEACIRAAEQEDPAAFYAANSAFHECVYRASQNRYLARQTLDLRNRLEAYRKETTFHPGLMKLSIQEHQEVLEAILSMDERRASERMQKHLDTLRNDAVSVTGLFSRRAKAA